LRSLKQATYTPELEGHYALASQDYCHFTSPIRRYPDLEVHRQLIAWLEGKKPKGRHDELTVLAQHCTRTERRAEAAERELNRIKLLTYLQHHVGKVFHAIVVRVENFGLFCRLGELPVEGLIHVTSLSEDFYYLEAGTHTLIGRRSGQRHRLGDRVIVRIAHVDVDRRALDLVLGDSPIPQARRPAPARTDSPSGSRPDRTARRSRKSGREEATKTAIPLRQKKKRNGRRLPRRRKSESGESGKCEKAFIGALQAPKP
jgi:ribonuclease R